MQSDSANNDHNIVICNFKGGVGKSLIAHQLITSYDYKGIEIDPYGSLSLRLPQKVQKVDIYASELPEITKNTIFDFGGFDDLKLEQSIKLSSLVIIPFIPTFESVQGTIDTVNMIKNIDPPLESLNVPVLFLANMSQKQNDINEAYNLFKNELKTNIALFTMPLSVALQTAINENRSIIEMAQGKGLRAYAYKKAASIIIELHDTILSLIN